MRVRRRCGLLWGGDGGRKEREVGVEGELGRREVREGEDVLSSVPLREEVHFDLYEDGVEEMRGRK
jgi:hypothetical protein